VTADAGLEVRLLTDLGEFAGVKASWDSLTDTAPIDTVFLRHSWLADWHSIIGDETQLHVLTAWDGEALVAALPLAVRKEATGIRRLEFMGSGILTPNHLDVIALPGRREDCLCLFGEVLADADDGWDVLDLDKVPADTETADILRTMLADRGYRVTLEVSAVCPYLDLPPSLDEYLDSLSKSKRRHLKQKRTRLFREQPDAEFRTVSDESELEHAMDALVRLHQERWQQLGYAGSFADPRFLEFQQAVASDALAEGFLRMSSLYLQGSIAAVNYDFRAGSTIQGYMTGFDLAWSKLAPGVMLDLDEVERAIEEGASRLDFLEGQEEWKYRWTSTERENLRLQAFGTGTRGTMAWMKEKAASSGIAAARRYVPDETREAVRKRIDRAKADRQSQ
jgi:CelD/BcsL family acetyltransferase involved in cellulose biosynthesis